VAKRSRRAVRVEINADRTRATAPDRASKTDARRGSPSGRDGREGRPRQQPLARQPGLIQRYRTLIFGGTAVVGLLVIGLLAFQSSTRAAYICDTELTPAPAETVTPQPSRPATPTPAALATASFEPSPSPSTAASPMPEPTPRLGFTTTILGRNHLATGSTITYAFCPPDSGDHYNELGRGPIPANVYQASKEQAPGGWVHNLEHGWVVLLYRCPSGVIGQGDCISQDDYDQLQQWYAQAPTPAPSEGCPATANREVLVARFDTMDTSFAEVAWGRAYLFDHFDLDNALTFAQQWMDHDAVPEPNLC
jgi:hypothetical protein